MQEISKIHVGLDVHKDSISVAVVEPGRTAGELVRKIVHDLTKVLRLLDKIGEPEPLHLV
jgi:transposase